jgi:hypothetical protein
LNHIRSRVAGEIALKEILAQFDPRERKHSDSVEEHEAKLPLNMKLATALFEAGKITEAEYFFHCGFYIVNLHERYCTDGFYDPELKEISAAMEKIEKRHGLKDNQYWLISDAPTDYLHESKKYDSVLEKKQLEVFRRFAPPLLTDKLERNSEEFWILYERGRRSVFEKDDHLASVLDLIDLYESEAEKCANVEAYYAAITMLGSAAESRMLLECLRQRRRVRALVRRLPKREQPRSLNPLEWTLANLVSVANKAGWLPNIDDGDVIHVVSGWAHRLRAIRNLLHPGRHVADKPHARLGKEEWLDAASAYTALRHAIEAARKAKRVKSATKGVKRRQTP